MPSPTDPLLYEKVKKEVYAKYAKPSAYRSGALVKEYKEQFKAKYGNREPYKDDKKPKNLKKWFAERWADIGKKDYPVYRPTKRVDKTTPLTPKEIDEKNLKEQIALKQKIKGTENLPPFKKKK